MNKLTTKNTPKISIIVPVYNVEQYIQKCILSIIEQIFTDYEAIIINDGSLDNSIKVITPLIKNDRRFSIINQENQGLGGARNTGIKKAKGEYMCFVDSDDYIEDDYLYLLYTTITKHNADICTSDINIIYDHGGAPSRQNLSSKNRQEAVKKILMYEDAGGMCHRMYKRHLFKNIQFKGFFCEDKLMLIHILLANNIGFIPFINKPLYNYVNREGSITTTVSKHHIDNALAALHLIKKLLTTYDNSNKLINYYKYFYIAMINFTSFTIIKFSKNFNEDAKYLNNNIDKNIYNWHNIIKTFIFNKKNFPIKHLVGCALFSMGKIGFIFYRLFAQITNNFKKFKIKIKIKIKIKK